MLIAMLMIQTYSIFLSVNFTLQVQRGAPCVTHENLTQLTVPSSCRFKELQSTNWSPLSWCIWIACDFVGLPKAFTPWGINWVFVCGLLSVFLCMKMNEIILSGFRKDLARFAPMQLRIKNDVIDLWFPIDMTKNLLLN